MTSVRSGSTSWTFSAARSRRSRPAAARFYIDEINLAVAGTGGGTAVACGILGLRTQAVTAIGDDASGEFMLANMQRHGIDVGLVRRLPGVATSATMLPVRPNGERPAWHVPGAAALFTLAPEEDDAALDADLRPCRRHGPAALLRRRAYAPRAGAGEGAGAHDDLRPDPGDRRDLGAGRAAAAAHRLFPAQHRGGRRRCRG